MKTTFNIGKEKYFRLFSIFEKGLKNYSKIFEKEDYVLTYVISKILQSYCNYFSIKDIRIIRPFKRFERNVATPHVSIPLEDRIFFEFFKHQSSLDFLD